MQGNISNNNPDNSWWHVLRTLLWGILFFACLLAIATLVGKCVHNNQMSTIKQEKEERKCKKLEREQAQEAQSAKWREEARISDSIRAARDSIQAAYEAAHPENIKSTKAEAKPKAKNSYRSSPRSNSYSYSYSSRRSHQRSYEDDDDDDTWYSDEDDADERDEYDYWE